MGTTHPATEQSNGNPEVFSWLKTLPLAPEYHPTIQEFKDPIAYIFKIEKEASKYGICKIVPPVPPQSKKTVIANLNRSLSARNPKNQPTFTTRQQQIGFCPRKHCPIQKSVWQSGEHYTLQQFEAKAKGFAKNYLKNRLKKALSPLDIETLYWKANGDRPFSVEYANDMPGSGFVPVKERKGRDAGEMVNGVITVGETAWNMRGISRANGSLLKFMKEEIPGVTSPMVYVAMMFSWFAWHVEDHDLHSLNYLHMGAGKTWYGVPRDAALAFEEVIRVHGYGDEINPLVTFAMLGEKTTVMSPEVLIKAGVPCCRLVQNAGEFVVTFPRAYHSGFSHGFNCGEASNIATPEWLRFAKDAAIRRASINYPPMVSHFQLLYDLALGIGSRLPSSGNSEPRSSRLKDRKKGEGETLVKQLFLQDVVQNNDLLHTLGKESTVVLLPPNSPEKFSGSNSRIGSKCNAKQLPFSCPQEAVKITGHKAPKETNLEGNQDVKQFKSYYSVKAKFSSVSQSGELPLPNGGDDGFTLPFEMRNSGLEREGNAVGTELSKRALFSCVKCGIWPFACAAIVQPTESAARYLMSADCNSFNDWIGGSGASSDEMIVADCDKKEPDSSSGSLEKNVSSDLYDVPIQCVDYEIPIVIDQGPDHDESPDCQIQKEDNTFTVSPTKNKIESSALGLLAMTYGNSSDSEDDDDILPDDSPVYTDDSAFRDGSLEKNFQRVEYLSSPSQHEDNRCENFTRSPNFSKFDSEDEISPRGGGGGGGDLLVDGGHVTYDGGTGSAIDNPTDTDVHCSPDDRSVHFSQRCNEDSSRMHVFCLEHAVEVERCLRPFGGVHILLLCHPDYPKVEAAAKVLAEELEMDSMWNEISFREATEEDEEKIQLALESEEATPKNGDWAVKLGINLYYSATLCRSPLYSKQMPYNSVIYSAFSCGSVSNSPLKPRVQVKGTAGRQKKMVMAGKWCGKVWTSNQVHHLLLQRDPEEEEEDEGTLSGCLRSNEKIGSRKPECGLKVGKTVGRKRKMKVETRPIKKTKFIETGIADSEEYEEEEDSSAAGQSYEEESLSGRRTTIRKPKSTSKKEKYPDKEIAATASDLEDYSMDSECNQQHYRGGNRWMKQLEKEYPQPCIVYKRMNKRCDSPPEDGKEEGGLTSPKRIRKQQSSSSSPNEEDNEMEAAGCNNPKRICRQNGNDFPPEVVETATGGPSTRLRKRVANASGDLDTKPSFKEKSTKNKVKKAVPVLVPVPPRKGPRVMLPVPKASERKGPAMRLPTGKAQSQPSRVVPGKGPAVKVGASKTPTMKRSARRHEEEEEDEYTCDIEGCTMSFGSREELSLHKRNICPVDGCDKKFFSHKYLVQHRRVHEDDRPLKCPWKGCKMSFKWAWARTEHIRVHTGARPYICGEPGCGQTFRFVSDFSRHKRKTGHSAKKKRKA
ncbi:hypothetical protein Dimus_023735 [Dionaea muscipula]